MCHSPKLRSPKSRSPKSRSPRLGGIVAEARAAPADSSPEPSAEPGASLERYASAIATTLTTTPSTTLATTLATTHTSRHRTIAPDERRDVEADEVEDEDEDESEEDGTSSPSPASSPSRAEPTTTADATSGAPSDDEDDEEDEEDDCTATAVALSPEPPSCVSLLPFSDPADRVGDALQEHRYRDALDIIDRTDQSHPQYGLLTEQRQGVLQASREYRQERLALARDLSAREDWGQAYQLLEDTGDRVAEPEPVNSLLAQLREREARALRERLNQWYLAQAKALLDSIKAGASDWSRFNHKAAYTPLEMAITGLTGATATEFSPRGTQIVKRRAASPAGNPPPRPPRRRGATLSRGPPEP